MPAVDITKSDWKLFRERLPGWQEKYMERLVEEYIERGLSKTQIINMEEIVKKCEKFYPRIELRLFLANIAYCMKPFMNSQAGSEAAAKAMELLRNCSDNITLYNQAPVSALEILLRDMCALNKSFGGVFCAVM